MQTWHCIILIALTISAFTYLTFIDDIEEETELTLNQLNEVVSETQKLALSKEINSVDPIVSSKSNLSQKILLLESNGIGKNTLNLHSNAVEGDPFFKILINELDQIQNIKKEIFDPFISELHSIDERTILGSLISCVPTSGKIEIICRGHSQRTADLLAELILRTYQRSLAFEKEEEPILPQLELLLNEIYSLQEEANELKVSIHSKLSEDPKDSIVVMATKSEILQVDQEISTLSKYLKEIESIYRNKMHPLKFVEIRPIAEFGQVRDLANVLGQLKSLQKDSNLNEFTKEEVKKKILQTSLQLETEVINAIDQLKAEVENLINRKKELQQTAVDAIEESRLSLTRDPAVEKLEGIRNKLALLKSDFDQKKLEWISAKKSITIIAKTN